MNKLIIQIRIHNSARKLFGFPEFSCSISELKDLSFLTRDLLFSTVQYFYSGSYTFRCNITAMKPVSQPAHLLNYRAPLLYSEFLKNHKETK